MKKNLLILIVCIISSSVAMSQINKSDNYLGGSLSYYSSSHNGVRNVSEGNISLAFGKAFKPNKIIGIKAAINLFNDPNPTPGGNSTYGHSYNFGVFYKDYRNITKRFQFFTESNIGYLTAITKFPNGNPSFISNGGYMYVNTGISFQVYKKLRLELALPNLLRMEYRKFKTSSSSGYTESNFSFTTGLNSVSLNSLSLGFNIIF